MSTTDWTAKAVDHRHCCHGKDPHSCRRHLHHC